MENTGCYTCGKLKANLDCGICKNHVCKQCAQFVDEDHFSYMNRIPFELSHTIYCAPCFDTQVVGPMARYDELIEKARNVQVFEKGQGKETRLMKRVVPPVHVKECSDRQETLLRLAFLAAELGFNGLIDVDIQSEKVIENSYQTTRYSGSGVPINLKVRA